MERIELKPNERFGTGKFFFLEFLPLLSQSSTLHSFTKSHYKNNFNQTHYLPTTSNISSNNNNWNSTDWNSNSFLVSYLFLLPFCFASPCSHHILTQIRSLSLMSFNYLPRLDTIRLKFDSGAKCVLHLCLLSVLIYIYLNGMGRVHKCATIPTQPLTKKLQKPNKSSKRHKIDNAKKHKQFIRKQQISLTAVNSSTLTPMHLRKAKLMFFWVRYPSSAVLKMYFPDIKFNKNNTAQLVKWFSNFR